MLCQFTNKRAFTIGAGETIFTRTRIGGRVSANKNTVSAIQTRPGVTKIFQKLKTFENKNFTNDY